MDLEPALINTGLAVLGTVATLALAWGKVSERIENNAKTVKTDLDAVVKANQSAHETLKASVDLANKRLDIHDAERIQRAEERGQLTERLRQLESNGPRTDQAVSALEARMIENNKQMEVRLVSHIDRIVMAKEVSGTHRAQDWMSKLKEQKG